MSLVFKGFMKPERLRATKFSQQFQHRCLSVDSYTAISPVFALRSHHCNRRSAATIYRPTHRCWSAA